MGGSAPRLPPVVRPESRANSERSSAVASSRASGHTQPEPGAGAKTTGTFLSTDAATRSNLSEAGQPSAKRPVTVEFLGRRMTLLSDAPDERVRAVSALLNERLDATQRTTTRAPFEHLALLTALNLAESLLDAEARLRGLEDEVRRRSRTLLDAVDALAGELESLPADDHWRGNSAEAGFGLEGSAVSAPAPQAAHNFTVPLPGA